MRDGLFDGSSGIERHLPPGSVGRTATTLRSRKPGLTPTNCVSIAGCPRLVGLMVLRPRVSVRYLVGVLGVVGAFAVAGLASAAVVTFTGNVAGTASDDELEGTNSPETIEGRAGDDTIDGKGGDDVLRGGEGRDILLGRGGDDQLEGGPGRDQIGGGSGDDMIEGGSGRDRLFGNSGDDTIEGDSGSDRVYGGSGDDIVHGGPGNDLLIGDPKRRTGNDLLYGEEGKDVIDGRRGNDEIYGGPARDRIGGGPGNDMIDGGPGRDTIFGNSGNDTITYVYAENKNVHDGYSGGSGNDTLRLVISDDELSELGTTSQELEDDFDQTAPGRVRFRDHGIWLTIIKIENLEIAAPVTSSDIDDPSDGDDVGDHSSIAISTSGKPIISHYNSTTNALRFTECNDPSCTNSGRPDSYDTDRGGDNGDRVGSSSSIAIGSNGNPIISHLNIHDARAARH